MVPSLSRPDCSFCFVLVLFFFWQVFWFVGVWFYFVLVSLKQIKALGKGFSSGHCCNHLGFCVLCIHLWLLGSIHTPYISYTSTCAHHACTHTKHISRTCTYSCHTCNTHDTHSQTQDRRQTGPASGLKSRHTGPMRSTLGPHNSSSAPQTGKHEAVPWWSIPWLITPHLVVGGTWRSK